jgi:hypothetical protein
VKAEEMVMTLPENGEATCKGDENLMPRSR